MVDFLEDIYKYANTIFKVKLTIQQIHYGYGPNISILWDEITPDLIDFLKRISEIDYEFGNNLYSTLIKITSYTKSTSPDYVLFADELAELIHDLYKGISLFGQIDVSNDKYSYSSSKIGFLSLTDIATKNRINSNIDPMWEAYECAQKIYNPAILSYHFIDLDLGYLPYQISVLSNMSIDIYIYALSQDTINTAIDFGVLSWIPTNKLHIIVNEDPAILLSHIANLNDQQTNGIYFHSSAIKSFPPEYTSLINSCYTEHFNYYFPEALKNTNAYRNLHNISNWISDFVPAHSSNTWAILAGGPSLDSQVSYIIEHRNEVTLLCVSTVLKKVLELGLQPDCVVTFDPKNRTYDHFKDLPSAHTPLLLGLNGNWQYSEYYEGPKYLIPCTSSPEVNTLIKYKNLEAWIPGSTVSTLAIKIALYFNAKKIRLFGYDLSYPNNKSHASGTMDYKEVTVTDMIEIPAANGGSVYTTATFQYYLSEITSLIKQNKSVSFINHSDSGAYIDGTLWYRNE